MTALTIDNLHSGRDELKGGCIIIIIIIITSISMSSLVSPTFLESLFPVYWFI